MAAGLLHHLNLTLQSAYTEWAQISTETLKKLVESPPGGVEAVPAKKKGGKAILMGLDWDVHRVQRGVTIRSNDPE